MEIIYLGHSAVCVKTDGHTLVFDYYGDVSEQGGLADGLVNLDELGDGPVLFFASHVHHDHFSKSVAAAVGDHAAYAYILGDFRITKTDGVSASAEPENLMNCISIQPHETIEWNGVRIHTGASTDCGVCFLVSCDGVNIFHAGDHANWGDGDMGVSYFGEIDYIAEKGLAIDVAFIPVCYFSGQRSDSMTRGAIYAMEKLAPGITVPIHANGREYLYREFQQDAEARGVKNRIVCMERPGERLSDA